MKILRIVPFVTTVIIMTVIFGFSSQSKAESSALSRGITARIVEFLPMTKNLTEAEKKELILKINHTVRKCAHFIIYAMLGFSAAGMFLSIKSQRRMLYIWILAVIFSGFYASTDEIHQLFCKRGAQIKDVFLDTSGAMTGAYAFVLAREVIMHLKKRMLQ